MTKLLNLPGVIIEDCQEAENILILSVKTASKTARCPRCRQKSHRLHQNQKYLVKDLPIGNKEVILKVNRRRFKCENCRKPFSEVLNFVGTKKNFTHRYAEKITEQVIHSDINNVAKNHQLTHEEVFSMVMNVALNIMPIKVDELQRLGIDEISLVKGQGKFIVVLVDLDTHKLLGLVSKRTQLEIQKIMLTFGDKVLSQIKEASPLVGIMHSLKEEFHHLFEKSQNLGEGILNLTDWLKKAEPYYKKSVKTIKRWFGEIVGYFEQRTTNAIVEGINNKLKLLKRCGFG